MMKEIRFRCWIEVDGEKFFGPGPLRLLQLIKQEGSLAQAAKEMGMSYKKAWDIINQLNSKASTPIVTSKKGGASGGGAQLTERGERVMASYRALQEKLNLVIEENNEILELL